MSDKILVYGCGDLAWAQSDGPPDSPFGEDWLTGRLGEMLPLEEGGAEAVSLCDELDAQAGWWPAREPPQTRVEIQRGRHAAALVLPAWEDLVNRQAGRVTRELRGTGVLVTPRIWSGSLPGRELLRAWGRLGWRWASLEEVLACKFSAEVRFVSAGSTWLRIHEPGGSAVVANGAEASCALEVTPRVLSNVLAAVSPELAAEWRSREEPRTGWFTRQQIVRRVAEALREGRRSVELGDTGAPLFRFSSTEASRHFSDLAGLRVTIDLPPLSAAIWWEQIVDSGFLQSPPGTEGRPAIRWETLETILLGNPKSDGQSPPLEIRSLHTYLWFNGRPLRLIDPVTLTEAREVGADLERCLARWEEADRRRAEPAGEPAAAAKASPEAKKPAETKKPAKAKTSAGEAKAAPRDAGATGQTATPAGTVGTVEAAPETVPDVPVDEAFAAGEPPTVDEPVVPELTAADPLFAFTPEHLYLEQPHRHDYVRVFLDGVPVSPENLAPANLAEDKRGYQLKGMTVPRGAIVRIDFEPE
jgi:hypothetical protein